MELSFQNPVFPGEEMNFAIKYPSGIPLFALKEGPVTAILEHSPIVTGQKFLCLPQALLPL